MTLLNHASLTAHLQASQIAELRMTIPQIEAVIGGTLPPRAATHQFWSNLRAPKHRSPIQRAIAAAGYRSFYASGPEQVRFVRIV